MRKVGVTGIAALILLSPACDADSNTDAPVRDAVPNQSTTTATTESVPSPPGGEGQIEVGELAADFPAELFPITAADEVLLSSFSATDDNEYRLSLNIRSSASVDEIFNSYEEALEAAGFSASADATVEGMAAQATFAKGEQVLTVGILDDGKDRIITVGGTIDGAVAGGE
ncbi:MAG TPA: hypothetical protein VK096_03125 [Actinomycetales bacterium]|nr:hypothetical protein [Actinomycetales bacterium]